MLDAVDATRNHSRATMQDVAARAEVGLKTVSRVVNNEPGVSAETRAKVFEAMRALRFSPDRIAGSLRRGDRRTQTIGLLLVGVDNPYDAAVHRTVEIAAAAHNVSVFASTTDEDPRRERELIARYLARRVDGLILMPCGSDLTSELEEGIPIVAVDREVKGMQTDCVLTDHFEAAELATEHLLGSGHRRIAFLSDLPKIPSAAARLAGYQQAMGRAGIPIDPELVSVGNHTEEDSLNSALRMITLPNPPTAIFSGQDIVTCGAVRALQARDMHHRIALVSFDDVPMSDLLDPQLTVIAQNPLDIGRIAAERLFLRMDDPTLRPERIVVPARLIRRGSGEIAPRVVHSSGALPPKFHDGHTDCGCES